MTNSSLQALMGYNFFFYALFAIIAFLPLYLANVRLDGTQIGLLLGIGPFFTIIAPPLWGLLSDKIGKLKEVLLITLLLSTIVGFILFKMSGFWLLFFILSVFYVFFAAIMPLTDSFTFRLAIHANKSFGAIRLYGSIGFAITSALLGVVLTKYGAGMLSYLTAGLGVIAILCLLYVKEKREQPEKGQSPSVQLKDLKILVQSRYIMFYFIMVLFVGLSNRMNDSFLSLYIKSAGGTDTSAGLAWFTAAICEATVFSLNRYWLKNGKENVILLFAIGAYAVRWLLLAWAPLPTIMVLLQFFHGLTFAVFYLTMLQQFTKHIPAPIQATGQAALLAIFFGFSGSVGSVLGGAIFEHFGGKVLYVFMGLLASVGLLCQLILMADKKVIREVN